MRHLERMTLGSALQFQQVSAVIDVNEPALLRGERAIQDVERRPDIAPCSTADACAH